MCFILFLWHEFLVILPAAKMGFIFHILSEKIHWRHGYCSFISFFPSLFICFHRLVRYGNPDEPIRLKYFKYTRDKVWTKHTKWWCGFLMILIFSWRSGVSCHCSTWIFSIVFSHSLFQEELLLPDQPDSSNSEEETNDVPDPADKECPVEEPDEKGACPVWQITSLRLQPLYLILLHSERVKLEMENDRFESNFLTSHRFE